MDGSHGLQRLTRWIETHNLNDHIEIKNQLLIENLMPDVTGMGAKDAIFLLENLGLKVKFKGVGRVRYQSIPQGRRIKKGMGIKLELS